MVTQAERPVGYSRGESYSFCLGSFQAKKEEAQEALLNHRNHQCN